MERESKVYTLRNGNKVYRASLYDGFNKCYFWVVETADGERYGNYDSYNSAYEDAKKRR